MERVAPQTRTDNGNGVFFRNMKLVLSSLLQKSEPMELVVVILRIKTPLLLN